MQVKLLAPKYWLIWIGFGLLRLIALLPFSATIKLGRVLGRTLYHASPKRREVARINIKLCFPKLPDEEQENLIKQHFESLGASLIEIALSWWKKDTVIKPLAEIKGLEHLHEAIKQGNGVILLSGHFNSLEFGLRLLAANVEYPIYAVYQSNANPLLEQIITRNRGRNAGGMISHKDIRKMIRHLKQNRVVWYAPDQGYRGKYSEIVPFFGIPSASNTATPRLAKISQAAVIPFFVQQKSDFSGYNLTLHPPIKNFPTDDPIADTQHYHEILQQEIQKAPSQYLWIHRRFKGRPKPYPDVYKNAKVR